MIQIELKSPRDEHSIRLVAALDKAMNALYPPESNHFDSPEEMETSNVFFVTAAEGGEALGCGAVKIMRDDGVYGEIKRIFVSPHARRRGIAENIIQTLEQHLSDEGIVLARLETGVRQDAAIRLYTKLGYRERAPFGMYRTDPLSVFMEKRLDA